MGRSPAAVCMVLSIRFTSDHDHWSKPGSSRSRSSLRPRNVLVDFVDALDAFSGACLGVFLFEDTGSPLTAALLVE